MRTRPKVILFNLISSFVGIAIVGVGLFYWGYTAHHSLIPFFIALLLGLMVSGYLATFSGKAAVDKEVDALLHVRQMLREFNQSEHNTYIEPSDYELVHLIKFIYNELVTMENYINGLKADFKKHQRLFDNMQDGLIIADGEGRILTINPPAMNIFEVKRLDASTNLLHIINDLRILASIRQVLELGKRNTDELHVKGKQGETYHMTLSRIGGESVQQQGIIIYIRDVTAIVKADQIRSDFVANVSHELKTPLTSIIGFSDLLQSGVIQEQTAQQKYLSLIHLESDRLLNLINDILKLSELESIAIENDKTTAVNLKDKAIHAVEVVAPIADKLGIQLDLQVLDAHIKATSDHISELFINLVDNAVKYNKEHGAVTVEVYATVDEAIVKVSDTGIGIPRDDQSRIFERFYRVDRSRSKERGGTGLGLSIVKHIVELYGGTVHLESIVGTGTTIEIRFPLINQ